MDATPAVDPAERRPVSPPIHDVGPLGRHVVESEALRGADQLAVHHPRGQRVDLARHQQGPDLVEQLEALGHGAVVDPHPGARRAPDHHCRQDVEALAELDRPSGLLAAPSPCRRT